jgi:hypothetical protein
MTDLEPNSDGFYSAASGKSPYRPATSLSAGDWSDRMQDALMDFRDVHTGARIGAQGHDASAQESHAGAGNPSGPVGLSVTSCEVCGEAFEPVRSTGRYCSATCRKRAQRAKVAA